MGIVLDSLRSLPAVGARSITHRVLQSRPIVQDIGAAS